MITDLHHVQIAMPAGAEDRMRAFYGGVLGLPERAKPPALAVRDGVWFAVGERELHCGVEPEFRAGPQGAPLPPGGRHRRRGRGCRCRRGRGALA